MAKAEQFTVATSIRLLSEAKLPWAKSVVELTKESGEYRCTCNRTEFYLKQSQRDRYEQAMRQQISEQLSVHSAEISSGFESQAARPKEQKNTAPINECGEADTI